MRRLLLGVFQKIPFLRSLHILSWLAFDSLFLFKQHKALMNPPPAKLSKSIVAQAMSRHVYLPDELIAEVQSFLPVNSLLRLKCVKKSWKTLISKPIFVKLHLHRSSRKRHIAAVIKHGISYHNVLTFPLNHLLENPSFTIAHNPYYRLSYKDYTPPLGEICTYLESSHWDNIWKIRIF